MHFKMQSTAATQYEMHHQSKIQSTCTQHLQVTSLVYNGASEAQRTVNIPDPGLTVCKQRTEAAAAAAAAPALQ